MLKEDDRSRYIWIWRFSSERHPMDLKDVAVIRCDVVPLQWIAVSLHFAFLVFTELSSFNLASVFWCQYNGFFDHLKHFSFLGA